VAPAEGIQACLRLTRAICASRTVEEIYQVALDALADGLGVTRSAVLLFDADGVMRFKAWRGLSAGYRQRVEGHTPWTADTPDAPPILVPDVALEPSLAPFLDVLREEGIAALGFIPLTSGERVIGKFMLYHEAATVVSAAALELAGVIAAQVAFAVERTRAEEQARLSEERLRFALDAATLGTWVWDLTAQTVRWSENLERIHGLPAGTFDGTFESYAREIHPDDRERVFASVQRALTGEGEHEVEYRLVAPDGSIRWAEGKGRVHWEDGRPVRMSGVCVIVTRRKEAEIARLDAAHEAARMKDEFLATLSHELRTPLNAILGWVQIVESGMTRPEQLPDALRIIGRNARLQAQLIEDILDVSRIISGKLEIDPAPQPALPLIVGAANTALPTAISKGVDLRMDVPAALPAVNVDGDRLQQVLGNILSNAIKFTDAGGRVVVRAASDGARLLVEVSDTGVGIPPEFLPYVFERFRQADSGFTRRHGGLGLGLAIARHLVDLHGGTIDVESAGAGRGTTIRLQLPVVAAAPAAGAIEPGTAPATELIGVRVLVVDDHPDTRELLQALFTSAGALVELADSAAAGMTAATRAPLDLLVADVAMPGVDGYTFVRSFRDVRPGVPCIAVSAYARPEDAARARAAGFDGYHPKPIAAAALLALAAEILRQRIPT
jgi:PAS domain S-box-containing protein